MASFLDKFRIKTALNQHSERDFTSQHITTADFMQLSPVYVHRNIPKEKFSVSMNSFARMAPMPVPTFGHCVLHNRAFFVPYRTIFPAFNDFLTNSVHTFSGGSVHGNYVTSTPLISNTAILQYLRSSECSTEFPLVENEDYELPYDFVAESTDSTFFGYRFNSRGRQVYKILRSLGYQVVFKSSYNRDYSALDLLAFVKVYIDWYFPAAYAYNTDRVTLERYTKWDESSPLQLTYQDLVLIFSYIKEVCYDSDYFTSAFDKPVGSNAGRETNDAVIVDNTTPTDVTGSAVKLQSNGTPSLNGRADGSQPSPFNMTQYALDTLKRLTDYAKRHQLAGARTLERYLARFGVQLDAEKLNRCYYVGSYDVPLSVQDIMSTAETTELSPNNGDYLGSYAGKGLLRSDGNGFFEFSSDEYGVFIICSSIVPKVGYYQGLDRHVLHTTRFDFWTPEFDGLGTQAISKAELYLPTRGYSMTDGSTVDPVAGVFGFIPRYAEYKVPRDLVTGDFTLETKNQSGDTSNKWHMFREFSNASFLYRFANIAHSRTFVTGSDRSQYDRLFYNESTSSDHFYIQHLFRGHSYAPCSSLFDNYDFEQTGKEVSVEANGVKIN